MIDSNRRAPRVRDGLPVPVLIEPVHAHAVELREILDETHNNLKIVSKAEAAPSCPSI